MIWRWKLRGLGSLSPARRRRAADRLVAAKAVRPLIAALGILTLAQEAGEALVRIGADAVQPLCGILLYPDPTVGARAAELLARIGDRRAVGPLLDLLQVPDQRAGGRYVGCQAGREAAARALGCLGEPRAVALLLAAALGDSVERSVGWEVCREAILALGPTAVEPLVEIYKQGGTPGRRHTVVELLAALDAPGAVEGLVRALGDPKAWVREAATAALEGKGEAGVEALLWALEHPDDGVRSRAADALGRVGGEAAVGPLIAALSRGGDSRQWIADALAELGDARAVEPLLTLLGDGDPHICRSALRALGALGDPRATEALLPFLRHPQPAHRSTAAAALGAVGDPRAVDPLVAALLCESGPVLGALAAALAQLGDRRAVEPLLAAWRTRRGAGRPEVAEALGALGDPRAVAPLIASLAEDDFHSRQAAILALGRLGDPRAALPLAELLGGQPIHRREVTEALRALGPEVACRALVDALVEIREDDVAAMGYTVEALLGLGAALRSVVVFRPGFTEPSLPEAYCQLLVSERFPFTFVQGWRVVGVRESLDPGQAAALYLKMVAEGRLPRMGFQVDSFAGEDPYGEPFTALLFAAEQPQAPDASEADLAHLRAWWRQRGREWWEGQGGRREAVCDRCNSALGRPEGYLHGSYLLCDGCCQRTLSPEAVEKLQANAGFFGPGELAQARRFAAASA